MEIYIATLGIIVFLAVLSTIINTKYKNLAHSLIIGLILFLISALRHSNVGTDLLVYIRRFYQISDVKYSELSYYNNLWGFEYGYLYFNKLISFISQNDRFLIVIISLIIIVAFSIFIYRYSNVTWLSYYLFITLFFFGTSLNILRMFIAISICLLSIKYIIDKKPIKFTTLIILAFSIHTTAIVFIALYPISKIKITKKYLSLIFIIGIVFAFFSNKLLSIMLFNFGYSHYSSDLNQGDGGSMLILLIAILILTLFFRKRNIIIKDDNYSLWIHMLILAILFNLLSLKLWIAARVMWYFKTALLIVIPNSINSIKDGKMKFYSYLLIIMLPLIYFYLVNLADNAGIIPYKFYWQ